jgi:hypothetical protein
MAPLSRHTAAPTDLLYAFFISAYKSFLCSADRNSNNLVFETFDKTVKKNPNA